MSRVLIVDRPQTFRKNGVGRYLLEITAAMEQMESAPDVRVLHFGRERSVPDWRERTKFPSPKSKLRSLFSYRVATPWALRQTNAGLIHHPTGNLHPNWDAGEKPLVLTLHGLGKYTSHAWYEQWQKDRVAALRRRFTRGQSRLGKIIAVSEYVKQQAMNELDIPADKITVVPNGVDLDHFYLEEDRELVTTLLRNKIGLTGPYIFHLGPGGPRKNVPRQIEAFARLKKTLDLPHKFVIAGLADAAARSEVGKLATNLGIDNAVVTIGEIQDDHVLRALYNGADMFLFPSLYEGFGIPVIEAMACGTPVVASATHSLPEASGSAAALVENPQDIDELTDVMQRIFEDIEFRKELCGRGLTHAQRYGWQDCARGHVEVYQRVLSEGVT